MFNGPTEIGDNDIGYLIERFTGVVRLAQFIEEFRRPYRNPMLLLAVSVSFPEGDPTRLPFTQRRRAGPSKKICYVQDEGTRVYPEKVKSPLTLCHCFPVTCDCQVDIDVI
jgi:hypothetical protein